MKRSRFTEEQVAYALRQAEAGTPVADVCRTLGVSEATFYVWRKKYANLGAAHPHRAHFLGKNGGGYSRPPRSEVIQRVSVNACTEPLPP
jgi:putative transposase